MKKFTKTCDSEYINKLNSQITYYKKENIKNYNKYVEYSNAIFTICEKYNLDYWKVVESIEIKNKL